MEEKKTGGGENSGTGERAGRRKMWIRPVMHAAFLLVFVVSAFMAVTEIVRADREAKAFEELTAKLGPAAAPAETKTGGGPGNGISAGVSGDGAGQRDAEVPFDRYDAVYAQNHDLFGWISIEGTKVDYPVMYTPEDPEHYLHRAFDGSSSQSGVPFLDGDCYEGCGNYILYGHHMRNGTMFATLQNYEKKEFWLEHPVIRFDTVREPGEYEVLAGFYARVYRKNEDAVFRYYNYTDLTDKETFDEFMNQVKAAALYDTGVTAEYGDGLLTLTTCSYHTSDGRFVVVAKRKEEP